MDLCLIFVMQRKHLLATIKLPHITGIIHMIKIKVETTTNTKFCTNIQQSMDEKKLRQQRKC